MLRNEVWQCSGVALTRVWECYYYPGPKVPLAIGPTQHRPRRWKSGKMYENIRSRRPAGVENLFCAALHHFHHFPTLIGARQHAQGLHKGRKWVKGAKITRFAWNGREITRFACNGRQLVGWFLGGFNLTCARTDFWQTVSNTSLDFSNFSVFVQGTRSLLYLFYDACPHPRSNMIPTFYV